MYSPNTTRSTTYDVHVCLKFILADAVATFFDKQNRENILHAWTGLAVNGVDGLEQFAMSEAMADLLLYLELTDNDDLEQVQLGYLDGNKQGSEGSEEPVVESAKTATTTITTAAPTGMATTVENGTGEAIGDETTKEEGEGKDEAVGDAKAESKVNDGSPPVDSDLQGQAQENQTVASTNSPIDVTSNVASAPAAPVHDSPCTRLRELILQGVPASALPQGDGGWAPVAKLLCLDLSFVDGLQLQHIAWGRLKQLQKLALENCDLTTLSVPGFDVPSLTILNVAENGLTTTEDLAPLQGMKNLRELDARGNSVSSGGTSASRQKCVFHL